MPSIFKKGHDLRRAHRKVGVSEDVSGVRMCTWSLQGAGVRQALLWTRHGEDRNPLQIVLLEKRKRIFLYVSFPNFTGA